MTPTSTSVGDALAELLNVSPEDAATALDRLAESDIAFVFSREDLDSVAAFAVDAVLARVRAVVQGAVA